MTNSNDKLPALAGLASYIAEMIRGEYLSGLWKIDLGCGLLWQLAKKNKYSTKQIGGPSWSWASYGGAPLTSSYYYPSLPFIVEEDPDKGTIHKFMRRTHSSSKKHTESFIEARDRLFLASRAPLDPPPYNPLVHRPPQYTRHEDQSPPKKPPPPEDAIIFKFLGTEITGNPSQPCHSLNLSGFIENIKVAEEGRYLAAHTAAGV